MTANSASQKRFGRDVLIAGAANLVRSLRNILLVPIITGHLSLAHYGEWELLGTAIILLTPWITFSLGSALIRFLPGRDEKAVGEGFYSIFFFVLASSILAAFVFWIVSDLLGSIPALSALAPNRGAIALVLIASSLLGIIQSYFRAFRQMLSLAVFSLAQHFGEFLLIAYLLQNGASLATALWALGIARILLVATGLLRILSTLPYQTPRISLLRTYLAFAIPLIPNSLFYRLYDSADRFFLLAFIGPAAVGIYAATYMAGSLFTTLISPIHTVLLPAMAALWNRGEQEKIGVYLAQTIRFSALLTFPTLAGAAVLADPLLALLVRGEIGLQTSHYLLLSVSFILFGFGIPFGDLMATAGQSRRLFTLNAGLAGTNLLLNLALIPQWGILGAIVSTMTCHSIYTLVTGLIARATIRFAMPWNALLRTSLAAVAMALSLSWYLGTEPRELLYSITTGAILYAVFLYAFGALRRSDIDFFAGIAGIRRK